MISRTLRRTWYWIVRSWCARRAVDFGNWIVKQQRLTAIPR